MLAQSTQELADQERNALAGKLHDLTLLYTDLEAYLSALHRSGGLPGSLAANLNQRCWFRA